jgi:hypothetical protein
VVKATDSSSMRSDAGSRSHRPFRNGFVTPTV